MNAPMSHFGPHAATDCSIFNMMADRWSVIMDFREPRIDRSEKRDAGPILVPKTVRHFIHSSDDWHLKEALSDRGMGMTSLFGSVARALSATGKIVLFGSGNGAKQNVLSNLLLVIT